MTVLREILEYVAAKDNGISTYPDLREKFNGDLTGLKVALDRGYLQLRFDCYTMTPQGLHFMEAIAPLVVTEKVCPQCQQQLPPEAFWKSTASGDGLFNYCIPCSQRKKRLSMSAHRDHAIQEVTKAAQQLSAAAQLWDQAIGDLAFAWLGIMGADRTIRQYAQAIHTDNDSGRMHARILFPRAAFALNLALSEAGYPQTTPLLREVGFSPRLADYVGVQPHLDYFELEGNTTTTECIDNVKQSTGETVPEGRPESGPEEGRAQQDHKRRSRHGARSPARSRRASVSRRTGPQGKAGSVPATGGADHAEEHHADERPGNADQPDRGQA